MNATSVGGRFALAIVLGVALVTHASCTRRDARPADAKPGPAGAAAERIAGLSIYDLDLALVESNGRTLPLTALRGHTLVAAMMYTSCTSVCPRVTEDMKTVERRLTDREREGVTFALFSLDPGRDTPAALQRFATDHQLDAARWRLFATSEDGVRTMAAVLGVKYARESSGDIAHSAMIFVIDGDGVVRHRQVGLTNDQTDLARALAAARTRE